MYSCTPSCTLRTTLKQDHGLPPLTISSFHEHLPPPRRRTSRKCSNGNRTGLRVLLYHANSMGTRYTYIMQPLRAHGVHALFRNIGRFICTKLFQKPLKKMTMSRRYQEMTKLMRSKKYVFSRLRCRKILQTFFLPSARKDYRTICFRRHIINRCCALFESLSKC